MYLVYAPQGQAEQRWHYNPGRLLVPEMKLIEKTSGFRWGEFQQELLMGSVTALQALLWTYLRRQHPALKVEDVVFYGDEVQLIKDQDELAADLAELEDAAGVMPEADRQAGLAYTRKMQRTAPLAPGKAPADTPAADPAPPPAPANPYEPQPYPPAMPQPYPPTMTAGVPVVVPTPPADPGPSTS